MIFEKVMAIFLNGEKSSALTTKNALGGFLFLFLIALAVYHPALNDGFIWDDDRYVVENENLRDIQGLKNIWFEPKTSPQYYPLTFTTFWFEYQVWGLKPLVFHFNNLMLHTVNAFLIWIILLGLNVPGAFLAGAIFAVHPVHVESVVWITERKNVLSCFFYLMSLLCYLRFSPALSFPMNSPKDDPKSSQTWRVWFYYIFCIVFFVCALLSKTVTASLPAVILVIVWWKKGSISKVDFFGLMPLFILGAAAGLFTAWLEASHVGASGEAFALTFWDRCLVAGRSLWFYLGKLLWPQNLMFIYPRWEIDSSQWLQYVFPISFVALIFFLYAARKKIGRGPLAAMLIFSGTLFPAIGFLNVFPHRFSFVADHFQYIASISIIAIICAAVTLLFKRYVPSEKRAIFGLVFVILLFNLGLKTANLSLGYKSAITLWKDTIDRNKDCWLAYNNLAAEYNKINAYDKAVPLALRAVRIKPDYSIGYVTLANSYYNVKEYDKAIFSYKEAIRLFEKKKDSSPYAEYQFQRLGSSCFEALGAIYLSRKDYDTSMDYFTKALGLKPDSASINRTIGKIHLIKGNNVEALVFFRKALSELEHDPGLHYEMGIALMRTQKMDLSLIHFEKAAEIDPNFRPALEKVREAQNKPHKRTKKYDKNLQPNNNP
jgi:tetratricopeptide (TPR) repeat protein